MTDSTFWKEAAPGMGTRLWDLAGRGLNVAERGAEKLVGGAEGVMNFADKVTGGPKPSQKQKQRPYQPPKAGDNLVQHSSGAGKPTNLRSFGGLPSGWRAAGSIKGKNINRMRFMHDSGKQMAFGGDIGTIGSDQALTTMQNGQVPKYLSSALEAATPGPAAGIPNIEPVKQKRVMTPETNAARKRGNELFQKLVPGMTGGVPGVSQAFKTQWPQGKSGTPATPGAPSLAPAPVQAKTPTPGGVPSLAANWKANAGDGWKGIADRIAAKPAYNDAFDIFTEKFKKPGGELTGLLYAAGSGSRKALEELQGYAKQDTRLDPLFQSLLEPTGDASAGSFKTGSEPLALPAEMLKVAGQLFR